MRKKYKTIVVLNRYDSSKGGFTGYTAEFELRNAPDIQKGDMLFIHTLCDPGFKLTGKRWDLNNNDGSRTLGLYFEEKKDMPDHVWQKIISQGKIAGSIYHLPTQSW